MSVHNVNRRARNQFRRKKLFVQKLLGLALIAVSVLLIYIASKGATIEEKDATAVLLTAPFGLYLLFTKKVLTY